MIECCTPLAGSSLDAERAAELELVLKALADRHRLRIVNLLLRADGEPSASARSSRCSASPRARSATTSSCWSRPA